MPRLKFNLWILKTAWKIADLDLHCFHKRILLGLEGQGLIELFFSLTQKNVCTLKGGLLMEPHPLSIVFGRNLLFSNNKKKHFLRVTALHSDIGFLIL